MNSNHILTNEESNIHLTELISLLILIVATWRHCIWRISSPETLNINSLSDLVICKVSLLSIFNFGLWISKFSVLDTSNYLMRVLILLTIWGGPIPLFNEKSGLRLKIGSLSWFNFFFIQDVLFLLFNCSSVPWWTFEVMFKFVLAEDFLRY